MELTPHEPNLSHDLKFARFSSIHRLKNSLIGYVFVMYLLPKKFFIVTLHNLKPKDILSDWENKTTDTIACSRHLACICICKIRQEDLVFTKLTFPRSQGI